jgi:hypothetical protein
LIHAISTPKRACHNPETRPNKAPGSSQSSADVINEACTRSRSPSRRNKRGVNLISNVLPFARLWYGEPNAISNAIDYAKFRSRSHNAVIRVCDDAGNVIQTHKHKGDFKEP